MKLKSLLVAVALCVGLLALPADATHTPPQNPRCGLWEVYGSTTTTIAHDTGQPYCDVQARTYRRASNGGLYWTTSPWRLYEAVAIETRGTAIPSGNNCGRYRERDRNGHIIYVSGWSCR